jgi:hypothetical protein
MPARFLGKRKKKKKRRLQTGAEFDGDAYESEFDKERLTGQILRVFDVMQDGHHHTVPEVCGLIWKKYKVKDPEPSISAQIRNLRKVKYGSHHTPRRHRGARKSGLWEFKLYVNDGGEA